ncbi:MAG: hypothetical protein COV70_03045 [Parcubacteria group bacterium CG11_big_fil_rev_8_21_14_0_20_39_22]|nr:MAG: hypothetical protein COV70_03045 [Parcubacteria group bacterium CG11_big_fil_rev_8_21_14_0_20_39_22]
MEQAKVKTLEESINHSQERRASSPYLLSFFYRATQYLSFPVIYTLFHIFLRVKITGLENLNGLNRPVIFVSNHVRFYDSFTLRLILKYENLPIRPIGATRFKWKMLTFLYSIGIIPLAYLIFGVITASGEGDSRVKKACEAIERGDSVYLHPEGTINKSGNIGEFRTGSCVIAQNTGAVILPIVFGYNNSNKYIRPKLKIVIGEKFYATEYGTPDHATEKLREEVKILYNKIND